MATQEKTAVTTGWTMISENKSLTFQNLSTLLVRVKSAASDPGVGDDGTVAYKVFPTTNGGTLGSFTSTFEDRKWWVRAIGGPSDTALLVMDEG